MQRILLIISLLVSLACGTASGTAARTHRTSRNLDPGWRFFLSDDAQASDSMAPDHQSRLASDGDPSTYWSAAPGAPGPQWWESDLEGIYVLSAVTLQFGHAGNYSYQIETSTDDRMKWHPIASGKVQFTGTPIRVQLPNDIHTSGIRIVFDQTPEDSPASLSEVQAQGVRAR